ncbi:DUF547 domain-containing protein [Algimonas porphyrae]|uniref:DUF547 domain-containing protein n=1 Tax=Algimonas porphyrae TaxID=1128113 RepID=A0ABQ5UXQ9_9PROT|nr:DUF547 domain-containing protein [Algimonas porphyrae]GLQ19343.1 hypothetical protein GCM10007854_02980 [Algimonas porphyrae]
MKHIVAALTLSPLLAISAPSFGQPLTVSPHTFAATGSTATPSSYGRFAPNPSLRTRLDFTVWDEALKEMVIYTGPSLRERAVRPAPGVGTRLVLGHTSPYRLEGNKVIFEGIDGEFEDVIDSYVDDLVAIGNRINVSALPRDEQLSYWLNLHNALVIQGIAQNYPTTNPSRIKGADGLSFHETKRVTIAGVPLSLRNIRQDVVYANWDNPLVIYGFFHGDLGSPSIQRKAFTAETVWDTLQYSGKEFAGSLRGIEIYGDKPRVSRHYEDAAPYFFAGDFDHEVRTHIAALVEDDLRDRFLSTDTPIRVARYATDIADMTRGTNNRTQHGYVMTMDSAVGLRPVSSTMAQSIDETMQKMIKVRRRGLFSTVTIEDIQTVPQEDRLSSGLSIEMELPDDAAEDGVNAAPE